MTTVAGLHIRSLELKDAQRYIAQHHRHHKPPIGHRFSIGVYDNRDILHGVCVAGRPVARLAGHPLDIIEVTRLCTDGTRNACSILYAAAARAAQALGYVRIQTYTLPSEGGTSLRAAGWSCDGITGGGKWKHTDGKPRSNDHPLEMKWRWSKQLNERSATSSRLALQDDSQTVMTLPLYQATDATEEH